jgi:hypothetical protein
MEVRYKERGREREGEGGRERERLQGVYVQSSKEQMVSRPMSDNCVDDDGV